MGWYRAETNASTNDTYGNSVTSDAFGNLYVTGGYSGTTFSIGTNTYTGTGGMYVVKYNASGNVLWVKTPTGTAGSTGNGISLDDNGNVFITGAFSDPSMVLGTYTLTSNTVFNDLFIVKFDPNGSVLWAKSAGGTNSDVGKSITIDNNGNAIISGYTRSPYLAIGTFTFNNLGQSVLVVKYDPNGAIVWAKTGVGNNSNFFSQGNSISTDANGDDLVTGFFRNSSLIFGTNTLTSAGSDDMFIAKFDSNGSVLWAKSEGGTLSEISNAISTDSNGNIFVTGYFKSTLIGFGSYTLTNTVPQNPHIFVAKYDALGNALWADGLGFGVGQGICTNSVGSVYATGYYTNTSIVFGTSTLTSNGAADIFVVEYDALGNGLSAASAGGSLDDYGTAITADGSGNIFVTGNYNSASSIFGAATLNNANTNNSNGFVGMLGQCNGTPQSPTDVTSSNNKNVCEVSSTTLSVTGIGIINWYSSPNSTLTLGSGYNFITPVLGSGNYTYYAAANTCTNSVSRTAITVTVNVCLDVANLTSPMAKFLVYPNPFQSKLFIDNGGSTIEKLSISNAVGQIILQQRNYNTSQSLDLDMLPAGIYFLKMEHEKERSVIKVIKE